MRDFKIVSEGATESNSTSASFEWTVNSLDELETFFHSRLPAIRAAARECGYAIGVHGSMRRDLDLIAVAWTLDAFGPNELAQAIQVASGGPAQDSRKFRWAAKPRGRIATSLVCCWPEFGYDIVGLGHIDLSVVLVPEANHG